MTPPTVQHLTDDHLEGELRAALDSGDPARIATLAAEVDRRDTPRPAPDLLASALWYVSVGLAVFPLQPLTKIPLKGSRGCHDATTDVDQVRAWWAVHPDANIGLATGGRVDVVDIDGLSGQRSRVEHWDMFDALPVIARVLTPRAGGMHLYVPATGRGNKAGLYPSVDYRGVGGYVVAPSSRTDVGTYRFLGTPSLAASAVAA